MPNQRRPGQTFIGAQLSEDLLSALEAGRKKLRLDRSQFVRDAILEKLEELGIKLPGDLAMPPDRARSQFQSQDFSVAETPRKSGEGAAPAPRKDVNYGKPKKPKLRKPKS